MNRKIFQLYIPIMIFGCLLLREALSYTLFLFPGAGWLWAASHWIGYDILPLQLFLDKYLAVGFYSVAFTLCTVIAAIYAAWVRQNLLVTSLSCHAALIVLSVYGYVSFETIGKYSLSAGSEVALAYHLPDYSMKGAVYVVLLLSILYGCALSHHSYLRRITGGELDVPA